MLFNITYVLLSILIFALPWGLARKWGVIPLMSPLHIVSLAGFLGVTVKTLSYLARPDYAYYSYFVSDPWEILSGYIYLTLFVIALCLGYMSRTRKVWRADKEYVIAYVKTFRRNSVLFAASAGLAVFVIAIFLSARGFEGITQAASLDTIHLLNSQKVERIEGQNSFGKSFAAIKSLFILSFIPFIVLLLRAQTNKLPSSIVFSILLALLIAFVAILQGKRLELLDLILYYLIVIAMCGQRVTLKRLLALGVMGFAIVAIFVVMTILRSTKGDISTADIDLYVALLPIVGSTYFLDINVSVILVNIMQADHTLYGGSYLSWSYAWIPRFFWSDKPAITLGPYLKQIVLQMNAAGGINPTGPGEAFLNFQWGGILIGFVLGFMYRKLEVLFLSQYGILHYHGVITYPLIIFPFIMSTLQSSFSGTVVTLSLQLVLVMISGNLLRRYRQKTR
ncbi:oligosaccharide repeat unit polymerase [Sulfitobacter sp. M220]|uniref:oligosaccharide repeat unit polymerase n=1 Tax=Sulfitobacter sp. M220 TaxID=2675333 RepID=UPI001EFFED85|nr:oligosaccharide repeat unit polymerase [Sulfitobacter sp. M220]MCF7779649.1 oligosaccharide repeat unit polymerase [Sulfitobacter sp. M220]